MKTRTLLISAAVALIALLAVPFAFAQRVHAFHDRGDFGPAMMLGHLQQAKEALDLSDQQVSDIKAIFRSLREQNQPYRQSLRGGMQQIAQALLNNPNDLAAAQALLDQQTAAEKTMKANALAAAAKALNVLSADQRTKLSDFMRERAQRWHK